MGSLFRGVGVALLTSCLLGATASAAAQAGPGNDAVAHGACLARAGDCVSRHTAAGSPRMAIPFGHLLTPNITPVVVNHLRFPSFNQRWSTAVCDELNFSLGTFETDLVKSAAWNRGDYLVEGLDYCSACHSSPNALGGIDKVKAYTGATVDGGFALNLTSELHTGLGQWSAEQTANDLKTDAVAGKTTVLGPMAEVVKNGAVLAGDPTEILKVVLYGVPAQGKYVPRPGFASQLSGQQVADLTNYLRGSWGNAAAANTTTAMSAPVRAAGSR